MTEYLKKYFGSSGSAPKLEIQEVADLLMSLKQNSGHKNRIKEVIEMERLIEDGIYSWHNEDAENYFFDLQDEGEENAVLPESL